MILVAGFKQPMKEVEWDNWDEITYIVIIIIVGFTNNLTKYISYKK